MFLINSISKYRLFICLEKSTSLWASMFHSNLSSKTYEPRQHLNSRLLSNYKRDFKSSNRHDSQICRSFLAHKYIRLIKLTLRENGPILENNKKLVDVINHAKQYLPHDFISFALRLSTDVRAVSGLYDMFFSGGCHFIVQYEDIDPTVTKHHLLNLCDKYDGNLIQGEAKWQQNYHQKGMITVRYDHSESLSQQSRDNILSTIKAESIHKEADAEGFEYWKVHCDPWKLHDVKRELSKLTRNIEEVYVGFLPKEEIYLPRHMKNQIGQIFCELSKVPTIDNVFVNFSLFK